MNQIALMRKRANMSQSALAERLKISQQAVASWETGSSAPRWEMVPQLAQVLNCTIDELFERNPPGQNSV